MKRVQGWCDPLSAQMILEIGRMQSADRLSGAVGEIGVHHGKLWLLLNHLADAGETSFAIDIFEDQHLNVDRSGRGDRSAFESNASRFGRSMDKAIVIQASSLALDGAQLAQQVGPVRLISIDGGHTAECTRNDLNLAQSLLCRGGVAVLDDVFNAGFPGVATGLAQYVLQDSGRLAPMAISPNKVFLTEPDMAARYRDRLMASYSRYLVRQHDFFGAPTPIFSNRRTWQRAIARQVNGTPLEPFMRRIHNRYFAG